LQAKKVRCVPVGFVPPSVLPPCSRYPAFPEPIARLRAGGTWRELILENERAVLVTTSHRGVFFGYAGDNYKPGDSIVHLRAARNVIYWPTSNHGFLGLAAMGPKADARVGPPADIELRDITCVAQCTAEAADKFGAFKWSR
jgi:hypothetical protein